MKTMSRTIDEIIQEFRGARVDVSLGNNSHRYIKPKGKREVKLETWLRAKLQRIENDKLTPSAPAL